MSEIIESNKIFRKRAVNVKAIIAISLAFIVLNRLLKSVAVRRLPAFCFLLSLSKPVHPHYTTGVACSRIFLAASE